MDIWELSNRVREVAFAIHKYLGPAHMERVYENALVNRLRKAGIRVRQQCAITVHDEDRTLLGEYVADLLVEDVLIVELKAARTLAPEHEAQLLAICERRTLNTVCSSTSDHFVFRYEST